MNTILKKLRVRQLEERIAPIRELARNPPPRGGWLRAVRKTFGMSTSHLATRLGITRQAVVDQERREVDGGITLASLRKAADAMGCDLYYAVVPRRPMTEILWHRAREVAAQRLRRVAHSMTLEEQSVPDAEFEQQVDDLAHQVLRAPSRDLWRSHSMKSTAR